MELDDFSAYRAMCTNRIQRLERYKKARSFCNLEEVESESSEASTSEKRMSEIPRSGSPFCLEESPDGEKFYDKENTSYEGIREKMMELMENDMAILQQLMNLGDQVAAMRKKGALRRTQSTTSMERAEEDDEFDEFDDAPFSASMSAVTHLVVDDSQPQYFSRQNSVLRIPIQPRRSNRFGSKRVPRRPSDVMRPAGQRSLRVTTTHDESSSSSSCESSSSDSGGPISPLSHTPSSISSTSSMTYSSSSASESAAGQPQKKTRSSTSSIDSGMRDESSDSPSPTFERAI